ncbi:ribonuclease H-like domain-containing protein [Tanacetum coccineum]
MAGSDDEIPPPPSLPPQTQTPTQQAPHTVSTIKLLILKKGEYDIWAMKMEDYLAHTDYPIWEVIQRGNGPVSVSTDTNGVIKVLPPNTAEEILARERERKARTTLLMALPEDHLAKFHKMTDAKEMWEAIKSRFGGNDESKKMQKYILKQQFEGFFVSNSEGLHKGYDMFQSLLSQLEIHGAGISTEDANQKFLRSLPSAWSQVSLIMRTKPGVDSLSFDDLYNNLRVFENDVKGSTASSSSTQNVEFVSKNTSSTNDFSTAYGVFSRLDHEDLEQLDEFDLEEMDLKWQVAMISMRMKKFYKKTGRKLQFDAKEPVGFDKTKVECYNCHKTGHFARECRTKGNQDSRRRDAWNSGNKDGRRSGKQEDSKALVTIDGEGVDWTSHSKEEEDYALMACNSSGLDTERASNRNRYTQALKKVEAQLVAHQQSQLWYEEKIRFMKIDLDDKTDVLTYHKKLLAEAEKEKEDLKAKVEKWHNSSKNLGKLLNTQMSANDKFGLGYGDYRYDGILSYENEVLQSVFMNKESDLENQPLYDRFVTAEGMHVVPPPMTGNYMPSGPDIEIDYSQFTYGPKQSQPSESETQTSDFDTCESNISVETSEFVTETVVNEPKVVSQPKVWSDAPIIEEYESDSEDEHVSLPTEEQETPSFANKQVKTPRETVKNQFTHSKNPKVDKKGLGYGFVTKACFVCGSLSHLIRDCDFHEKRMAKQAELNNRMRKKSSQREIRTIWNNVQRVNHKNQFVPTAVLTRTGKIPVNTARASGTNNVSTARHNLNRQAVPTNAAMKVNTVKPIVNNARPKGDFHKSVSPFRKSLNRTTALRTNFSYQKVNTAEVNAVSAVGGKRETADYPHRTLQNKGIVDSGCSRHMTGNKAYLAEYQDFNGGRVAFGGSKGYITAESAQDYFVLPIWSSYTSTVKSSKVGEEPTKHPDFQQVDKEDQIFLDELERIKRQEQDANDAAEALRKEFAQETEDLLLQARAAKASNEGVSDLTSPIRTLSVNVSPIPSSRIKSIHPSTLILRDPQSAVQTRSKVTKSSGAHALNKKDERGVVVLNKASLVAQGHKQEEGINYDEVFAPVAKIEAIRIFLAFDSYMGFMVYQMDVKIMDYRKELVDILFLKKGQTKDILYTSYVDDIIFGSTKKSWCDEFEALVKSRFQMSSIRELTFSLRLQVKQKEDGIFISQDKYVAEILKKFDFASVKTASTPIETLKPLVKDEEASDVDVTPKTSHLNAVKRIFRYLKGKPKLGLWYPRVSSFNLEAYSDSDYARENIDRKSTTGGILFLQETLFLGTAPLQKEKGVELKDVENIERPRLTSTRSLLTLKSLLKIDPKDKGKKKIKEDESDTESEDINETKKKFKMLAHDEEIARKMQEDWETEEERKRLAEEEATNAALIQDFDNIKVRMEADRLLA